jgi:hypothetical protein
MNSGFLPNQSVQVGAVNTPVIFEPPPALITSQAALEIWIALSSTSPEWGGAAIYMSLDGNSYASVGQTVGDSAMGVTTADLPSFGGANPDTTDTLSVNLTESNGSLTSVSADVAANLISLVYCGGELLSYETATLTAANKYNLTTLYRGAYGTTIADHPLGSAFAALGGSLARLPFPASLIGSTIYFKFPSFNTTFGGQQNLSDVPAYSHVVTGAGEATSFTYVTGSVSGKPGAGAIVQTFVSGQSIVFPAGLSNSAGSAGTPATAPATFAIKRNGSSVGTMVFAAASATATFTMTSPTTFAAGDVLTITAPAIQDATLANIGWTLVGTLT